MVKRYLVPFAGHTALFFFAAILLAAGPSRAAAQSSCLPEFTSLQVLETVQPPEIVSRQYPLLAEGPNGRFTTRAVLRAEPNPSNPNELLLKAMFDPDFDGVSLAYNLYAVSVIVDGIPAFFHDFTNGCEKLPVSFYPGRQILLPSVKLIGDRPQKLQIMLWGRL